MLFYDFYIVDYDLLYICVEIMYGMACQEEREYAAEQSARVIDAYRTLTDALARAMYIVSMILLYNHMYR